MAVRAISVSIGRRGGERSEAKILYLPERDPAWKHGGNIQHRVQALESSKVVRILREDGGLALEPLAHHVFESGFVERDLRGGGFADKALNRSRINVRPLERLLQLRVERNGCGGNQRRRNRNAERTEKTHERGLVFIDAA